MSTYYVLKWIVQFHQNTVFFVVVLTLDIAFFSATGQLILFNCSITISCLSE